MKEKWIEIEGYLGRYKLDFSGKVTSKGKYVCVVEKNTIDRNRPYGIILSQSLSNILGKDILEVKQDLAVYISKINFLLNDKYDKHGEHALVKQMKLINSGKEANHVLEIMDEAVNENTAAEEITEEITELADYWTQTGATGT